MVPQTQKAAPHSEKIPPNVTFQGSILSCVQVAPTPACRNLSMSAEGSVFCSTVLSHGGVPVSQCKCAVCVTLMFTTYLYLT